MDEYKLHREHRPVGRLGRFIEVVTAISLVLTVVSLLR
jgi:hypothetical protein